MASFLSSPSSDSAPHRLDTIILIQLEERERELDQLMTKIDVAQSEFDRLSAEVAEKTTDLQEKKFEFARAVKAQEARELAGPATEGSIPADSEFNFEHLTFLNSKRSEIGHISATLGAFEQASELQTEVAYLRQDVVAKKAESANLKKQIERAISRRRKLEEQCDLHRGRIKETEDQIHQYRTMLREGEMARTSLLVRRDTVAAASDPVSGFPSVLENLQKELDVIKGEQAAVDYQIRELQEQSADGAKPSFTQSARERDRSSEWMLGMDEDLERVQDAISEKTTELDAKRQVVRILEGRYKRLEPVVISWKKRGVPLSNKQDIDDVDKLLRQVPKSEDGGSLRSEIDALAVSNTELYSQITRLKREISTGLQALAIEESRLKKQILKEADECSKREKEIVDEMYELRLKAAQKKLKRNPSILSGTGRIEATSTVLTSGGSLEHREIIPVKHVARR
jgi:predicted  nucleic acid-binding Zn-ribbon protein